MIDYDKEDDDPIVAEVRRAREQLLAKYGGDLKAMMRAMQQKTEESARQGRTVVSPPARSDERLGKKKKAG